MFKLNRRAYHRAVSVGDSLFLWAGQQDGLPIVHDSREKRKHLSSIQHFPLSTGQWISRATTGAPPLGVISYFCTAIDNQLYFFGGWCGHEVCYHNSITQLDTERFQWKELVQTDPARPVMRRCSGGMMSFEHEGAQHLLMIGGVGSEPTIQLPYVKYMKFFDEIWRTNEHSIYNLSSKKWSIPAIAGQFAVPTANFVTHKISNNQAVLFGGAEDDGTGVTSSNNVYILKISFDTVCWECIKKPKGMAQWPSVRRFHAGDIFTIASDCPMLVISGGIDKDDTLGDYWIFNITQKSWRKLEVASKRRIHTLSVFVMSCYHVWLIATGGIIDDNFVQFPENVTLTELVINDKGEWMVHDTFDSSFLGSEKYKSKYLQLLQFCRRKCLEEKQDAPDSGSVESLVKDLKDKEAELQQKEKDFLFYRKQLELKEQEFSDQLQAKEKELLNKERELRQSQEVIQQQALTDDHWVINKDEVILTGEELGRGSYANVKVGIFRGLRVAVKSLHAIIISDYSLALFSREMSIASQVRHPNLVQFIGATKVDNPLILTELMSTSLLKVLQNQQFTKQQILSIAQDVALGLNYLHLFQPQPIIHRDISSPNVLLEPSVNEAGYKAKVADYGTAKLQHVTSTGTVMPGNPAYSAPEAPIPDRHTPAMDVYSYSVLLMEMALRSPPEMTTVDRERQSHRISWFPMKSLIQSGINNNYRVRPTMGQVIELLKVM